MNEELFQTAKRMAAYTLIFSPVYLMALTAFTASKIARTGGITVQLMVFVPPFAALVWAWWPWLMHWFTAAQSAGDSV